MDVKWITKKLEVKYVFIIAVVVTIVDQIIKILIDKNFALYSDFNFISDILSITKIYNTGAAFSIFEGQTLPLALVSLIAALLMVLYFLRGVKQEYWYSVFAWGLILGGTIGNFLDRIFYGYVIDYIKLDFINFPIFNLADIFINIGAIIVLTYIIFENKIIDDSQTK